MHSKPTANQKSAENPNQVMQQVYTKPLENNTSTTNLHVKMFYSLSYKDLLSKRSKTDKISGVWALVCAYCSRCKIESRKQIHILLVIQRLATKLILKKISKIGATRSDQMCDFKAKMYQIQFPLRLRPRTRWGSL